MVKRKEKKLELPQPGSQVGAWEPGKNEDSGANMSGYAALTRPCMMLLGLGAEVTK
jgi:hypothetical protein